MNLDIVNIFNKTQVRDVIDSGDFEVFKELADEEELWDEGLYYIIETKNTDFITDFIKRTGLVHEWVLTPLCAKRSKADLEQIFDQIIFPQSEIIRAGIQSMLFCLPEKYFDLLNRLTESDLQENMIQKSIWKMFVEHRNECIGPLLDAMEGRRFLSGRLKDIAVLEIFKHGSYNHDEFWTRRFLYHPIITHEVYAEGLVLSWRRYDAQNPVFKGLLVAD